MQAQVAEYLRLFHVGEDNAVKSRDLESIFHVNGETLRSFINSLREEGTPICSGRKGYWYAENLQEVLKTRKDLIRRIQGIQRAVNGLDKHINDTLV